MDMVTDKRFLIGLAAGVVLARFVLPMISASLSARASVQ